ncbi:AcrR family transcriptional regulator [Spinactinospora alkalitolerans]|uniref:AcrR family transcriptional regulator n=1 Tax=Spinactinospora alkalitolerans TaxID=687207 RepID=A0A852U785_9ACTN|nr:TetR family transcriptional regulator [Spinactinospora alkalitolerans]NYE49934.1 AcrR family transcriptional regulator [Spinactinospora alkalitolerans]
MARTGRRPGATQTREKILEAARAQFSEKGYDGATIRGIAREAGVDPALVHHFFGAKDQVFIAAMRLPYDPGEVLRRIIADTRHDRAEAIVRFFLDVWEDPRTRAPMLALVRSAATQEQAATTVRGFMKDILFHHVAGELGIPALRAALVASQLFGMVLVRYVIQVEPLASAAPDEVIALYAPALRAVIEE